MIFLDWVSKFFSSLFATFVTVYIWHKLLNIKINLRSKKTIITILSLSIISIANYYIINLYIRVFFLTVILMMFFRYLFKETINKCVLTPIISQIIVMVSETLYLLVITVVLNVDLAKLFSGYLGTFMTNIIVPCLSIVLIQFRFIKFLYDKIILLTEKVKKMPLLSLSIVSIIALGVFPTTIYYKIDLKYLLIFYSTMILLCCIIVFYSLKTQSKYNVVSDKYNIAINSLKEYENMMTKYRIANHENKNLLLTIRAMIINKEKDIPKYIDSIMDIKYEDDDKLLHEMNIIPSGGLRATIYSEILKIKENNINYSLTIDKKLSTIDLIELDENTIIDVCKIISVFIDNAIDEVKKLRKKNIDIQLYANENNVYIKVSNNYKNKIDIENIYEEGYTTKGKNHGYGLSLVKMIIGKNKSLDNQMEITKTIFSQLLVIKYKKSHQ